MKILRFRYRRILILIMASVLLLQCSTEKNTPFRRSYHNLTSYFNILFNGKESFEEGITRYQSNYQNDFTRRLPIFIYGNQKLSEGIKSQMDRAVEKASKVVRLHSITAKPENLADKRKLTKEEQEFYNRSEFNRFVDDSYLLMGKAYFWQMDYSTASKILEYAINEFKDEETRLRSKIWLTRSYIELNKFRDAEEVLQELDKVENFPASIQADFYATYADYYIKLDQLTNARKALEKAANTAEDKEDKIRYTFILGQLFEDSDQPRQAFQKFDQVVEMNPGYRMKFNARLKKAWLFQLAGIEGREVKKELMKMLKDEKNSEYRDQIYYALAKIAKAENKMDEAINNYKQSARTSKQNVNQKGLSYLALADIYFDRKYYEEAQAYYDSAVTSLETDYPGYTDLYIKNKYLTKLVSNLNTIERQDSLQRVAQMSDAERNELINTLIARYNAEQRAEKEKQRRELAQRNQISPSQLNNFGNQNTSSWYFYSQTAVERGKAAFVQKWGNRELEDNWRRSSKSGGEFEDFERADAEEQKQEEQHPRNTRKYYLEDLPMNDSLMKASHQKIQEAYFNVGMTYMNDLDNTSKAIEAFEELNKRYPNSKLQLPSYYHLYKLYKKEGNASMADRYKNRIISKYPQSNYARVLKDPDYFKKLEDEHNKTEKFYASTMEAYKNGNYNNVIQNYELAKESFNDSAYLARFDYLKTLSIGKTEDIISFRKSLEHVTKSYPGTDVAKSAEEMLAYLNKTEIQQLREHFIQNKTRKEQQQAAIQEKKPREPESPYNFEEGEQYYFVVMANTKTIDIGRLKFDLINFNLDYFLQKDYNTTSEGFNDYYTVVTVKRFESLDTIQTYYNILSKKEERVFADIDPNDYHYFYISVKNYLTLLNKKSVIEYINFFDNKLASKDKIE